MIGVSSRARLCSRPMRFHAPPSYALKTRFSEEISQTLSLPARFRVWNRIISTYYRDTQALYRDTRLLYRSTKSLERDTKALYRDTRFLYRSTEALYCSTKALYRDTKALYCDMKALYCDTKALYRSTRAFFGRVLLRIYATQTHGGTAKSTALSP